MKSKLKIFTSYVSPVNINEAIEQNYLPIFAIRKIYNSPIIGKYTDTAIHFKKLSPSQELYQNKRDNKITLEEFKKQYVIELSENVNLIDLIEKLEILCNCSKASGVIIFGYDADVNICHRGVLSQVLNNSGLLENLVEEFMSW